MYESNCQEVPGLLCLAGGEDAGSVVVRAIAGDGSLLATCRIVNNNFGELLGGLAEVGCNVEVSNLWLLQHADTSRPDKIQFFGRMTLARRYNGIGFQLTADAARTLFLSASISHSQFAELVVQHRIPVTFKVRNPDRIGLRLISEVRTIIYEGSFHDSTEVMEEWIAEHGKEDGWFVNPRLRSQGSITSAGGTRLSYSVYRYE